MAILGAVLLAFSMWTLLREVDRLGFAGLTASLRSVSLSLLAVAAAITALNYLVLTFHDLLAFSYAGVRLAARQITLASFVGYALANNVGFAMLSGASARYRFYARWGIQPGDISRIVLFYSTTFWVGLCLVGGAGLMLAPPAGLADVVPRAVTMLVGLMAVGLVIGYVVVCAVHRTPVRVHRLLVPIPPLRLVAAQMAVSTADWLLAACVLFVLLPSPRPDFTTCAAAFAAAQIVGLASHVPGGVGVFEGGIVLLLSPLIPASGLLPALALYRIVYYLAPLAVALGILLVDEAVLRRHSLTQWSRMCRMIGVWAAPRALAFFAFISGVVLLVSGATPSDPGRLAWLARVMPLALVEVSHFTASMAGVFLLLLAQAIWRRVDAAFYVTAAALAIGCVASLLKGADYEEATILAIVLVALCAGRRHFTRRARIFEEPMSPIWLVAVGAVVAGSTWLGFFAYRHVAYSHDLWWRFAFNAEAPRFLRASVAAAILALAVAVRQLLHPATPAAAAPDLTELPTIDRVISLQPHTSAYLAYLGDKSFLWNESRSAFLMYAIYGRSCVALGDPVGPPGAAHDLITRFLAMADQSNLTPVFYQTSAERLADYIEYGLTVTKIGEEARVPLDRFTTSGARYKALRSALNHARRLGFTFRVVEPIDVPLILPELQEVSDEWLALKGGSEKGFSLGFFDARYLQRFPMALLESQGRVHAFANLWCGPGRVELSADLMRHRASAPNGVMDALFMHAMLWGQAQHYRWFNLGVAPLSGLRESPVPYAWSRVAHFVYGHGGSFYNFQGLRAYKDKFDPVWEPRYIVYSGSLALPRVIADVTALVAGGYRRLFLRRGRSAA